MARSINEIKNIIIAEKNKKLELNELESDSKVSIFNSWAFVSAAVIHSFEVILDVFKTDINNVLDTRINGTPQFYVNEALKYQDGESLEISEDGTRITYPTIDDTKKIITRASYEETVVSGANLDKLLLIKVAKGTVGNLQPLNSEELVRFSSYLNKIKFAGTNIQGVSRYGDVLIPRLTVYHDGTIIDSIILARVNAAIHEYMKNLPFDSTLYVSKLLDAINDVENVTDVYIDPDTTPTQGVFIRPYDDNGVIQAEEKVGRSISLRSGYLKESSKDGQEATVGNFNDVLIIKAE